MQTCFLQLNILVELLGSKCTRGILHSAGLGTPAWRASCVVNNDCTTCVLVLPFCLCLTRTVDRGFGVVWPCKSSACMSASQSNISLRAGTGSHTHLTPGCNAAWSFTWSACWFTATSSFATSKDKLLPVCLNVTIYALPPSLVVRVYYVAADHYCWQRWLWQCRACQLSQGGAHGGQENMWSR